MPPSLFIISIIAAAICIVALTHASLLIISYSRWSEDGRVDQRHQKKAGEPQETPATNDDSVSRSADFTALIDTIAAEGRANRAEERREDDAKRLREYATILLLGLTVIVVSWQVYEMRAVYDPIKEQASAAAINAAAASRQADNAERALIQATRAWVGPSEANLEADPKNETPVDARITYQNTGKEPAIQFAFTTPDRFTTTDEDDRSGRNSARIAGDVNACRTTLPSPNGQVIYPTSFSAYTVGVTFPKEMIGQEEAEGKKFLIIQGCFVYVTTGRVHHSMWCYLYKTGQTKKEHLNICAVGNYAD
ncbi:MAG TPA: hypothetical protein VKI44_19695 [Acetobacteraceae bacterium]|nr:hypothetical protein [Acetobacteraceae bacterium]